ncbi:unnamed protein product [Symbiodinium pilosum]|uniref:Uncharacterized protein n=1 Tax=Symbiodinium pilosum TaxID=2952 RepID=A0A812ITH3_SYMPI|nr:unnamed protein product [Symbiodinium pilosum]
MHFNPFSTFCAKSLAIELLDQDALAAVVLEMFDERWQRMQTLHPSGSFQRTLLDNEMQAVAETAGEGPVPVLFADLSDEELDVVLQQVSATTLQDMRSLSGWSNIVSDVADCFSTLASGGRNASSCRNSSSELDGSDASSVSFVVALFLLLVSTPIAIFRNILVLAMEAPFCARYGGQQILAKGEHGEPALHRIQGMWGRLAPQTTLMDEVILANLQALPKATSSSLGLRVATAFQRLLSAYGVHAGPIRVLKVNSFKDGQRDLLCDIDIPFSSSPCGVARLLERALFSEEAQRPEATSLLHVLRAVSAQISTLKVEIRPSKERLVNSLRMAIPKTIILPRRVDSMIQASLKFFRVYRPVLDTLHKEESQELESLLTRPSLCLRGGHLVAQEPQMLKDTCWHGVRELSGLLAISQAAHLQLKELLAPGSSWAKTVVGDVPSKHPSRAWQSGPESLLPDALHLDPGVKRREKLVEEVLSSQRAYELQDTAAHDLLASRLHVHFETLADLCTGLARAERSLDIVWLRNRFRDPDCFGYPCVQSLATLCWEYGSVFKIHDTCPGSALGITSARSPFITSACLRPRQERKLPNFVRSSTRRFLLAASAAILTRLRLLLQTFWIARDNGCDGALTQSLSG